MACKLPVIVSNVGMNKEILEQSEVGIGIESELEWGVAIEYLILNPKLRQEMGGKGRLLVNNKYCLGVAEEKWRTVINLVNSL
jgi:glycosyltransferase involved in cell wall biosynthesis